MPLIASSESHSELLEIQATATYAACGRRQLGGDARVDQRQLCERTRSRVRNTRCAGSECSVRSPLDPVHPDSNELRVKGRGILVW